VQQQLPRRALAEFIGTAMLLAAVVGSGIMGAKLSAGNDAVALLANSIATGGALVALVASLGPISGAHFNPAVTAFEFMHGRATWKSALLYCAAQLSGAIAGVVLAHAMFEVPLLQESARTRATVGEQIGEAVATFGLLLTIWGVARSRAETVPYAVAAYIVGAYWFTSSTSFANPAVTIARSFTDTFAGIAHDSILGFLIAQGIGAVLAVVVTRLLSTQDARASEP
jgi:glycerol uptake facilitator-like aquaporin